MLKTSTIDAEKAGLVPLWPRFELLSGIIFMVAAACLVHLVVDPGTFEFSRFRVWILAPIFAHVFGYFAYRRFDLIPGMAATGAVLPTFLLTYGVILAVILLFRLDYSRLQLVASFLASVSWYLAFDLVGRRLNPYQLGIVPGGKVNLLEKESSGVSWRLLASPAAVPLHVQGVVVDLRADLSDDWERFIARCALAGTPVYHVKQVLESLTGRVEIEHLSENTLGSLNPNQVFAGIKLCVDWLSALVLLFIMSPLMLAAAIAVRFDSPGPALFRQERMGYRGRVFTVYKFRTMRDDARNGVEDEKERYMTREADVRVTRLGSFLRRTRLDELPQIINILRGEMSWIGPRPEALPLSRWYEAELPFYTYRHIVRPGITGWAQVNQGHVTALDEALEKLHYDFYYIKNFSAWLDIAIAARTVAIIVTGFGAR